MKENLILMLLVLLGIVGHSILKANSLVKDAEKANVPFTWKDYLKKDILGISISLVAGIAWFFLFEEVATKYPALQNFVRCTFFGMGALGSYVCQLAFSRAKTFIRKQVDFKTDVADGKLSR